MRTKIIYIILCLFAWSFANSLCAQEILNKNWDGEKIKGVRNLPYPPYRGLPFLSNNWMIGKIEFVDGEIADSLNLRYSSYKDEVVYYNKTISTQIVIEKASLKGFSYADEEGNIRNFRKQFFDDYLKADRFFEVLAKGETDLLAYRKSSLSTTVAYRDEKGILINLAYTPDYQFYFYSPGKGYTSVKPNRAGLIAKFAVTDQRPVKKLLRKNKVRIADEEGFLLAWKIIEKGGFKVLF
jgi:hypothetical protein